MVRARAVVASVLAVASCGVRTPGAVDVAALVARHGPDEARRELAFRIANDPKDIAARLALATLDERDRPASAIEQLELVDRLGGPLGTRWRDDDRARLARLLLARARARLARGAATADTDLERAAQLGARVEPRERDAARALRAIAELRHVDARQRRTGMRTLAALWTAGGDRRWAGARDAATPAERGGFGAWLWSVGARRAAWEELAAWHDATPAPRDPALAAAYLTARAWWVPYDGPPPAAEDLVGPTRCRFTTELGCHPAELLARAPLDDDALAAALAAPPAAPVVDGKLASGWLQLSLLAALRGEGSWGPLLASRVDLAAVPPSAIDAPFRQAYAALSGRAPIGELPSSSRPDRRSVTERLVIAAGRVLRGARDREVAAALAGAPAREGAWLLRVIAVPPTSIADPVVTAVVANVRVRVPDGLAEPDLRPIVVAYLRDPAIADRLGRDAIARAADAGVAHGSLGAVFDALGDPARARAAWQAAVELSPEGAHLRGLAEATARAKDPDAALVAAVTAAAASGDPAPVWTAVARALEHTGEHVHALDAARSAIGLASSTTLVAAIDVAIEASAALGRTAQVAELTARRAQLAPPLPERAGDPTDAVAALHAHAQAPTVGTTAQLWVAARWNRRHVGLRAALIAELAADDPRRQTVIAELVALAADPDPEVGRDAVRALRGR